MIFFGHPVPDKQHLSSELSQDIKKDMLEAYTG
jgi:hypothetical protein